MNSIKVVFLASLFVSTTAFAQIEAVSIPVSAFSVQSLCPPSAAGGSGCYKELKITWNGPSLIKNKYGDSLSYGINSQQPDQDLKLIQEAAVDGSVTMDITSDYASETISHMTPDGKICWDIVNENQQLQFQNVKLKSLFISGTGQHYLPNIACPSTLP